MNMLTEKPGIKTRIFTAALLISLCLMLALYIYNILSVNKQYINDESKTSTECLYLNFEIISAEAEGNDIFVTVKNLPTSSSDITAISMINGRNTITKEVLISPFRQKEIAFENLDIKKTMLLFPNNCEKFAKQIELQV